MLCNQCVARVEDIIERYRNEFILDNLRLVKPFTLVSGTRSVDISVCLGLHKYVTCIYSRGKELPPILYCN